jgi:multidrug efflux system membrane fusion protein
MVVTSGVTPGTIVVVDGADKLREGAKVEVITREGQQVAPARQGGQRGPRGDRPPGEGKGQGRRNGAEGSPPPGGPPPGP